MKGIIGTGAEVATMVHTKEKTALHLHFLRRPDEKVNKGEASSDRIVLSIGDSCDIFFDPSKLIELRQHIDSFINNADSRIPDEARKVITSYWDMENFKETLQEGLTKEEYDKIEDLDALAARIDRKCEQFPSSTADLIDEARIWGGL